MGCSGKGKNSRDKKDVVYIPPSADVVQKKPQNSRTERDWTPDDVQIHCAEGLNCPLQVGLLIYVYPAENGRNRVQRCTAFLTAVDEVTSNGHCDYFGTGNTGYFVTNSDIPGGKQIRKIVGVRFRAYTPHPEDHEKDSGRPDAAVFRLDQPISLRPLAMATVGDAVYSRLTAFVMNQSDQETFVVNRVDCGIGRQDPVFPFDVAENPDVLIGFNCVSKKGNSGSPMFAPGSSKVQAIAQSTGSWTIRATNVRCLSAPRGRCAPVTDEAMAQRMMGGPFPQRSAPVATR